MATFTFRYQTLLDHRRRIEDEAQRELAKHLRVRSILQDQLRNQQETIHRSKHELTGALVGKVDLTAVGRFARYSGSVAARARQIVGRLAQLEDEVAEARSILLDATRKRKALELLRDRHHGLWRREQDLRETAELDDLSTQRYARRVLIGGRR